MSNKAVLALGILLSCSCIHGGMGAISELEGTVVQDDGTSVQLLVSNRPVWVSRTSIPKFQRISVGKKVVAYLRTDERPLRLKKKARK